MWYHSIQGGAANTGSIVAACGVTYDKVIDRKPRLYEVYSVPIPAADGGEKAGTILIDPGSDTNYICHDYAKSLGLQGVPYSCYLKVFDTEYVQNKSA